MNKLNEFFITLMLVTLISMLVGSIVICASCALSAMGFSTKEIVLTISGVSMSLCTISWVIVKSKEYYETH